MLIMIGLMDCNNFFVSCERLFRPDLEHKPVVVLSGNDGVIVARSNEVKAMGVPMGIPLFQAKKLVDMSGVTFFSTNFSLYRDISRRVMRVLADEVGECEIYSVDEAFFTLTNNISEKDLMSLRQRIIKSVGIPVSIGAAKTKTLAKIGSSLGKKNTTGVCLLNEEKWNKLASDYLCQEVWNLGPAMTAKLRTNNITTAADFMNLEKSFVAYNFGISGRRIQDELLGISVHKIGVNSREPNKSIASTRSFSKIIKEKKGLESALVFHVSEVAKKLRTKKLLAGNINILARASRHSDFNLKKSTSNIVLERPTNDTIELTKLALKGLSEIYEATIPYKKVGITVSGLIPEDMLPVTLFTSTEEKSNELDKIRDQLNNRFGAGTLRQGVVLKSGPNTSTKLRSPHYTTVWIDIPRVVAK